MIKKISFVCLMCLFVANHFSGVLNSDNQCLQKIFSRFPSNNKSDSSYSSAFPAPNSTTKHARSSNT